MIAWIVDSATTVYLSYLVKGAPTPSIQTYCLIYLCYLQVQSWRVPVSTCLIQLKWYVETTGES